MKYTEEHVTRAASRQLVIEGWEIVAVHPPDGQGPFVIPKPPVNRRIERSSFHPDVVAVRPRSDFGAEVMIMECKLREADLQTDLEKLQHLARNRFSILFALYRCQKFDGGPDIGVHFEEVAALPTEKFPVRFGLAAMAENDQVAHSIIEEFSCITYLFSEASLG
jgi:hypothetical protein